MASFAQPLTFAPSGNVLRSAGVHVRFILRTLNMYCVRMTAICSRVTGPSGSNVVGDVPATTLFWYAQRMAGLYQFAVRSVNGVVPLTAGVPSRL